MPENCQLTKNTATNFTEAVKKTLPSDLSTNKQTEGALPISQLHPTSLAGCLKWPHVQTTALILVYWLEGETWLQRVITQ